MPAGFLKLCTLSFFLLAAFKLQAVTYLTHEDALGIVFKTPADADRHEIFFDMPRRKAIEEKFGKSISQKGVLAFSGLLKSGKGHGAVLLDAVVGKHEMIDYMVVLDQKQVVQFIEILAYRESYGSEIRRPAWRKQFEGKTLEQSPEHNKNIVNISGATLSSRNVSEGVRKLLAVAEIYAKELGLAIP